jgi:hypothetical protein
MKRLVTIIAFLSLGLASAFGQQTCPIEIKRTDSHAAIPTDGDPWGSALKIEFINHAKLNTTAVKFGVYFANTMGEHEQSAYYYTDNETLKPEKLRKSRWPDGVYTQGGFSLKALAWVERAGFADGSVMARRRIEVLWVGWSSPRVQTLPTNPAFYTPSFNADSTGWGTQSQLRGS